MWWHHVITNLFVSSGGSEKSCFSCLMFQSVCSSRLRTRNTVLRHVWCLCLKFVCNFWYFYSSELSVIIKEKLGPNLKVFQNYTSNLAVICWMLLCNCHNLANSFLFLFCSTVLSNVFDLSNVLSNVFDLSNVLSNVFDLSNVLSNVFLDCFEQCAPTVLVKVHY